MNNHFSKTCAVLVLICCLFAATTPMPSIGQVTEGGLTNPIIRTGVKDTNGKTIIGLTATTNADDYLTITNGTADATISTAGADTNIDLNVGAKGSGNVQTQNTLSLIKGASGTVALKGWLNSGAATAMTATQNNVGNWDYLTLYNQVGYGLSTNGSAATLCLNANTTNQVILHDCTGAFTAYRDMILRSVYINNTAISISAGSGTPEGAVTAAVGSLFLRTDGGAGTTLYVKQSGTGNTGWAAK